MLNMELSVSRVCQQQSANAGFSSRPPRLPANTINWLGRNLYLYSICSLTEGLCRAWVMGASVCLCVPARVWGRASVFVCSCASVFVHKCVRARVCGQGQRVLIKHLTGSERALNGIISIGPPYKTRESVCVLNSQCSGARSHGTEQRRTRWQGCC